MVSLTAAPTDPIVLDAPAEPWSTPASPLVALSSRSAPDTLNDAAESWRLVTATTVSTVPLVSVARSKKKLPVRLLPAIVAVAPMRLTRTNGPAGRLKLWGASAPPGNVWLIAADVVLTSTVTAEVTVRMPARETDAVALRLPARPCAVMISQPLAPVTETMSVPLPSVSEPWSNPSATTASPPELRVWTKKACAVIVCPNTVSEAGAASLPTSTRIYVPAARLSGAKPLANVSLTAWPVSLIDTVIVPVKLSTEDGMPGVVMALTERLPATPAGVRTRLPAAVALANVVEPLPSDRVSPLTAMAIT